MKNRTASLQSSLSWLDKVAGRHALLQTEQWHVYKKDSTHDSCGEWRFLIACSDLAPAEREKGTSGFGQTLNGSSVLFFFCVFISRCGGSSERDSPPPMAHLESPGQGSVSQALYLPTHTQEHYKMSNNTVFTQQAAHVLCTLSRQLSNTYLEIAMSDLFFMYTCLHHYIMLLWSLRSEVHRIRTGHRAWNLSLTLMCMHHESLLPPPRPQRPQP